jgi:hypothetical protein
VLTCKANYHVSLCKYNHHSSIVTTNISIVQAIGLTEKQFKELMSIPLTFFYMRIREDTTNESNNGSKMSRVSKTAGSKTTRVSHANPVNRETGVDETKHTTTFHTSKQTTHSPDHMKSKSMVYSQSTSGLDSIGGNQVDAAGETSQSLKMLSWSGQTPALAIQSKKQMATSTSLLSLQRSQGRDDVLIDSVTKTRVNQYRSAESIVDNDESRRKKSREVSMSTGYSVYDLEMATQDTIDPSFYFTLSKEGVTQYSNRSSHFTSLGQWHREFLVFHRICAIRYTFYLLLITAK